MSDDRSSVNIDHLRNHLSTSLSTRVTFATGLSSLDSLQRQVNAACQYGNIPSTAVPTATSLLEAWRSNDSFADAVEATVSQDASGQVGLNADDVEASMTTNAVGDAPDAIEYEAAEMVGFAGTSGFVDDPICAFNGNFIHGDEDLATPGFASVLDVVRVYNSLTAQTRGAFGYGWSSVLEMELQVPDSAGVVRVVTADGGTIPFFANPEGGYHWNSRRQMHIEATDTGWTVHQEPGDSWRFDHDGVLVGGAKKAAQFRVTRTRSDSAEKMITLTEKLSGRWVRYHLDADSGLVSKVDTSDGRAITYDYVDGHCVRADRAGNIVTYEMNDDGLIEAIFDADHVMLCRNQYDETGRVIGQIATHGRETSYEYLDNNVLRVTDNQGGPTNVFGHDDRGNMTSLFGGNGAAMRMTWDHRDRMTRHVDREGNVTGFEFDATSNRDLMVARLDADGLIERREFDNLGRMIARIDRAGRREQLVYDDGAQIPRLIEGPDGAQLQVIADERDLPMQIIDPDGVTTSFMFDEDGQLVAVTNGEGERTVLVYDKTGQLVKIIDPDGAAATFERDERGLPTVITTVDGEAAKYTWSPAGRVIGCQSVRGSWRVTRNDAGDMAAITDAWESTMWFEYDHCGQLVTVTGPDGSVSSNTWNAMGHLIEQVDPLGRRQIQKVNRNGDIVGAISADGHEWACELDELGRMIALTTPTNETASWTYHPNGEIASVTDLMGQRTTYEVDVHGRRIAEITPDGQRVSHEYTPGGRRSRTTTAAGRVFLHQWDAAGRYAGSTSTDGTPVDAITAGMSDVDARHAGFSSLLTNDDLFGDMDIPGIGFSQSGLIAPGVVEGAMPSHPMPANAEVELDERGLVAAVVDPSGTRTSFARDICGRVANAVTGEVETRLGYDAAGRVSIVADAEGGQVTIGRNGAGQPTMVRYAKDGATTFGWDCVYDPSGLIDSLWSAHGDVLAEFGRNANGQITSARNGAGDVQVAVDFRGGVTSTRGLDGLEVRYERDVDGFVTRRQHTDGSWVMYERDATGGIVALTDSVLGKVELPPPSDVRRGAAGEVSADAHGRTFSYDVAGRLNEVVDTNGEASFFVYNDLGLLSREQTPTRGRRQFQYDNAGQLEEVRTEDPRQATSYAYDAAGRRVASRRGDGTRMTYEWNAWDQLTGIVITNPDGSATRRTVEYSALNRPERVDGISIGWDDAMTGKPVRIGGDRYLRSGASVRLVGRGDGWSDDHAGDPWGDDQLGDGIHLGFNGELTIDGLVFMGARVYDPATRVFLTRDPETAVAGATAYVSAYLYAGNDPVNFLDPTGLRPIGREEFDEWKESQERNRWENAWEAIKEDPWGTVAMVGIVIVGAVLLATPLAPIGVGILIGAGSTAAIGIATNNFSPTNVAIGGAFGAIVPGGLSGAAVSIPKAVAYGAATSAASDVTTQLIDNGFDVTALNPTQIVVSTVVGGAASGVGQGISNKIGGADIWSGQPLPAPPVRPTSPALVPDLILPPGAPIPTRPALPVGPTPLGELPAGPGPLLELPAGPRPPLELPAGPPPPLALEPGPPPPLALPPGPAPPLQLPPGAPPMLALPAGPPPRLALPAGPDPFPALPAGPVPAAALPPGPGPLPALPAGPAPLPALPAGPAPAPQLPAGPRPAGALPAGPDPFPALPPGRDLGGWTLPPDGGGGYINGRWYTEHALERMAPRTPSTMAQLEARAVARARAEGLTPNTPEWTEFMNKKGPSPRSVPVMVVEAEIANPGSTSVRVITNASGGVVTVIQR